MKQLTKKEVVAYYKDYKNQRRLMYPAMLYNYFIRNGIQIYKPEDKQKIWDQAIETEEMIVDKKIQEYRQKNLPTDNIKVKESNITYEAKRLAVLYYFNWLEKNNKNIFTNKK